MMIYKDMIFFAPWAFFIQIFSVSSSAQRFAMSFMIKSFFRRRRRCRRRRCLPLLIYIRDAAIFRWRYDTQRHYAFAQESAFWCFRRALRFAFHAPLRYIFWDIWYAHMILWYIAVSPDIYYMLRRRGRRHAAESIWRGVMKREQRFHYYCRYMIYIWYYHAIRRAAVSMRGFQQQQERYARRFPLPPYLLASRRATSPLPRFHRDIIT